ncbi:MAG: efflux RND transporter periplasmic adaptor subunit [Gammaproteobacteria bacterium]|nr:efflux RND transporter periplasmic adaptor subunit [Gammaproteobacteria bacterium]
MKKILIVLLSTLGTFGCEEQQESVIYDSAAVERRDIVIAVEAAGIIEPYLTVEVKSKASGEILNISKETGDFLEQGELLVEIDKRAPHNQLAQAEAELEAALARRSIAEAQSKRSKTLLNSRTINDVDYEKTILEFANAKAEVIRSQVAVENARIALDDTTVRAPISGTVIEKLVETGQVISSPTMDVGGGTLLLKMADLSSVQVKSLVDETDIGKIQPGQPVTVTVASYPNQPFEGNVAKIEPKAVEDQTVTTFSVLVILRNDNGLLRPGMNADVEIRIAERRNVVAVRTVALRVDKDIPVSSKLVGLSEEDIRTSLSATEPQPREEYNTAGYRFTSRYWVLVEGPDGPKPVSIDTGLTDLDFSEVLSGLDVGDRVLLLPSSGLILSQQRLQQQMKRFTSMPGMDSDKKDKKKSRDGQR